MREWTSEDGRVRLINGDCVSFMKGLPDKCFELAIVDPPYFDGGGNATYYNPTMAKSTAIKPTSTNWRLPDSEYFAQLFRVSVNQIIWGCNYYAQRIPHVARIVWHKETSGDYSDCEIASWSQEKRVRYFRYRWNGMIQEQGKDKEKRHHPTQKPVALYRWLLHNYANEGDRILDTHGGSMSSVCACHEKGFAITCCELDADYYNAGLARVQRAMQQQTLELGV
jgi:site-specific DNA-methyltransferase (adenine-specific)